MGREEVPHNAMTRYAFRAQGPAKFHAFHEGVRKEEGAYGVSLCVLYLGISVRPANDGTGKIEVGFCAHDGTYSIDFAVECITVQDDHDKHQALVDYFIPTIRKYEKEHLYKFAGVGITKSTVDMCPTLPGRLWADLDIVPMVFQMGLEYPLNKPGDITVDEEADSMARKCLMFFGPSQQPRLMVGFRNQVEVDSGAHAQLTFLDQYKETVGEKTWRATLKYADALKQRDVKVAWFNSTPQGGGVALMRHALIRFLRLLRVNATWYTPRPRPEVFRITKTNHNILQGVADPKERLTKEQQETIASWVQFNADRFWSHAGGPLASRAQGGADIVIVDDPQMPGLIDIAKKNDPSRPVVFRSHIQIRADLTEKEGSPTAGVWQWLWESVQHADVFISHPVASFVPKDVPREKVGFMPATTDWLDGLNKDLAVEDFAHYIHLFNVECLKVGMRKLDIKNRDYIVQIARFDPSKGIPDVLAAYAELRRTHFKDTPPEQTPQLVLAGHGAVDDPDGTAILDETLHSCDNEYKDIREDIIVMRLGPTDQTLNALMSGAKVALQLSTREGFEVKVSEALHKGIPIIATNAGGIPLQVEHEKSGFIVEPGDYKDVAKRLYELFTDEDRYKEMATYAKEHVSDEVGTVGNALSWLYLADSMTKGEFPPPKGKWINDLARDTVGEPYEEGERRLKRETGF